MRSVAQIRMKSRIFPVYGLPRPAALRIIIFKLDSKESVHQQWHVPFSTVDHSAAVLSTGDVIDVTLKQQESAWFAYVRISTDG